MGVRFASDVRRLIVAATTLAEARGHSRPQLRDLIDGLNKLGETVPPVHRESLDDDLEEVLGIAAALAAGEEVTVAVLLRGFEALGSTEPRAASRPPGASAVTTATRSGIGYDSHRFAPGGPLVLGGIRIDSDVHCVAHSDGDAVCHALTDAILGAAGAGDIGTMFPDTDPANAGRNSVEMLTRAMGEVRARQLTVANVDVTVIAERPKIGPHREAMRAAVAGALGTPASVVSIKGKTNEGMGLIGRGEGIAVIAIATLVSAT